MAEAAYDIRHSPSTPTKSVFSAVMPFFEPWNHLLLQPSLTACHETLLLAASKAAAMVPGWRLT